MRISSPFQALMVLVVIISFSAFAGGWMAGCNNRDDARVLPKSIQRDSLKVLAIYTIKKADNKSDSFPTGILAMIIKDTLMVGNVDSTTGDVKAKWVKDSSFFVPIQRNLVDSNGKALLDTTGNPLTETRWFPFPKIDIHHIFPRVYPLQ